jgi:hypothetical protein
MLPVKVEIESDIPQRTFADLRRELIEQGKKFDENTLRAVLYSQLNLCCIGNAGVAACSLQLVQQEKVNRRERFLYMESDEFKEAEHFLKIEQMYDDVMFVLTSRAVPQWADLNDCQKLWTKLTCLYNHVDNPSQRLQEALALFAQCANNPASGLPSDVCSIYASKLRGIASVYPGRLSDDTFRDKVGEMAETLLEFMPDEDRKLLEKEQLQGYSCTSDCFRIIV